MKRFTIFMLMFALLFTISCSNDKDIFIPSEKKVITVETYGWINYQDVKRDDVVYKFCVGNVVWSVLTSGTIVIPVLLTGYNIMEPVRIKKQ